MLTVEAERVEDLAMAGMHILSVGFAEAGRPTVLLTDDETVRRHEEAPRPEGWGLGPLRRYPATIVSADGRRIELGEIDLGFPVVEELTDSRKLIVSTRCDVGDRNAVVFDRDGGRTGDFAVGDGVRWVHAAASGDIWVGYFDEGIFGRHPISGPGIVRFGLDGEITYRFEPLPGRDIIADCYAMCTDGDLLWAYYYSDFAVVRIAVDGSIRMWETELPGARALAVHDGRVLLYGGYWEARHDVHLGTLGDETLTGVRQVQIVDDRGERLEADQVVGRGGHLHILRGTVWWRIDLNAVPA